MSEESIAAPEAAFRALFAGTKPQREAAREIEASDPFVAKLVASVMRASQ